MRGEYLTSQSFGRCKKGIGMAECEGKLAIGHRQFGPDRGDR